jgi:hypothetical protein
MSSKHIKRPNNSFMEFAKIYRPILSADNKKINNTDISRLLGKKWMTLSSTERQYFKNKADIAKMTHKCEFPDYKYKPRSRKEKILSQSKTVKVTSPLKTVKVTSPLKTVKVTSSLKTVKVTSKLNAIPVISMPHIGLFESIDYKTLIQQTYLKAIKTNTNHLVHLPEPGLLDTLPVFEYDNEVDEFDLFQSYKKRKLF